MTTPDDVISTAALVEKIEALKFNNTLTKGKITAGEVWMVENCIRAIREHFGRVG